MAGSASLRTGSVSDILAFTVIRYPTLLIVFCLGYPGPASAHEAGADLSDASPGMMTGMGATGETGADSPYAMHMHMGGAGGVPAPMAPFPPVTGRSPQGVRPVVILPLPPLPSYPPGTMPGLHGPGSYVPREVPLHRFNGYVVCDPPPQHAASTAAGAPAAGAEERPKRIVKTTSTRSLAAPGYQQPCPIYTVNGQLPSQEGYPLQPPSVSGKPEATKP